MTQVRRHNEAVLRTLEVGDLVAFDRIYYTHVGVYVGAEEIVHLYLDEQSGKGCVKKEDFWSVAGQSTAKKNNDKGKDYWSLRKEEIKSRALGKLGTSPYDVLKYNCEHFANWCRYDQMKSVQVDSGGYFWKIAASVVGILGIFTSSSSSSSSSGKR